MPSFHDSVDDRSSFPAERMSASGGISELRNRNLHLVCVIRLDEKRIPEGLYGVIVSLRGVDMVVAV